MVVSYVPCTCSYLPHPSVTEEHGTDKSRAKPGQEGTAKRMTIPLDCLKWTLNPRVGVRVPGGALLIKALTWESV
jgi:hypothetical protein